jgi:uncharacterized protein with beta-barrel porin domain
MQVYASRKPLTGNALHGLFVASVAIPALVLGLSLQTAMSHAQSINMGTAGSFAVLAGSTVTNTGPTVLEGDLGVFPGTAIVGFPPGSVLAPFTTHAGNAIAGQAKSDLTTAYNVLAGTARTVDLSGQNLGGRTLAPGVYNFSSSAQLTGPLVLNAGGNPNAVFIFNIGSTLTTATASSISLIGGAQGQNVFFRVGSAATLGAATSFVGDILALTSITLGTGANITCGAAMARNGAVTLDTNRISISTLAKCLAPLLPVVVPPGTGTVVPPGTGTVVPPVVVVLPPGVIVGPVSAVTTAINNGFYTAVINNQPISPDILGLSTLSPAAQAYALTQLSGEAATAVAPASAQAMNSFLRLVLNPFAGGPFGTSRFNEAPSPQEPEIVIRALGYAPDTSQSPNRAFFDSRVRTPSAATLDSRRWGVWAAAYGDQNRTKGGSLAHDRTIGSASLATGLDYRVTPDTVIGFALAGGGTDFDLSGGLGGGHSEMFQTAVYNTTRFDDAYVSGALAYAGHWGSTERELNMVNGDRLTSSFFASNLGARIETGYRFAMPDFDGLTDVGFTPYAAVQGQVFSMPSYHERGDLGPTPFALAYNARTTNTARTEIGAWFDRTIALDDGTLVLRARAAWAHDYFTGPATVNAVFQALPGSGFTFSGAEPTKNSALLSAGAWLRYENGLSFGAKFDGEFAARSQTYAATGIMRYTW